MSVQNMQNRNALMSLYKHFNFFYHLYFYLKTKLLKFEKYVEYFPDSGIIVDIGCGYGLVANYLALCFPNSDVIGIDTNFGRIKVASTTIGNRKNIKFLVADAGVWDMPNCAAIIMTAFLHHVSYDIQKLILSRAYKNLHKKGMLLIVEINVEDCKSWNTILSDRILYPFSTTYFSKPSVLLSILKDIGFEVEFYIPKNYIFSEIVYVCRKK